jgi:hypothetical protein
MLLFRFSTSSLAHVFVHTIIAASFMMKCALTSSVMEQTSVGAL